MESPANSNSNSSSCDVVLYKGEKTFVMDLHKFVRKSRAMYKKNPLIQNNALIGKLKIIHYQEQTCTKFGVST